MIAEMEPTIRWIERDGKLVLQYKVRMEFTGATDEEIIAHRKERGEWRDVPVVKAGEASK